MLEVCCPLLFFPAQDHTLIARCPAGPRRRENHGVQIDTDSADLLPPGIATVARRTSEIGMMALGADRSGVVAMILRSALLQTLLGLAIGVPVAFYGVTLVKSQLYELTTVSSSALAVAVGILLAAACVAGVIPARRAASVDPVRALRSE